MKWTSPAAPEPFSVSIETAMPAAMTTVGAFEKSTSPPRFARESLVRIVSVELPSRPPVRVNVPSAVPVVSTVRSVIGVVWPTSPSRTPPAVVVFPLPVLIVSEFAPSTAALSRSTRPVFCAASAGLASIVRPLFARVTLPVISTTVPVVPSTSIVPPLTSSVPSVSPLARSAACTSICTLLK